MKKITFLMFALLTSSMLYATGSSPKWMSYPRISPDGKTIAFGYKGDIFTVPVDGGRATQLTTNPAHDSRPIWSLDGTKIAFSSNREGNFDIYLVDKDGGSPKQLTTHSANEYAETFLDNNTVLYISNIQFDSESGQFPSPHLSQVYSVSTNGGRPTMFSSLTMETLSINEKGDLLYQDKKGYEDTFRKHHTSAITRDIWITQAKNTNRTYKKLTSFNGEDRNPVWDAKGENFFYLSEADGSYNIYKRSVSSDATKQLTKFKNNPIRNLSASKDNTLCFTFDGDIYTLKEGASPKKLNVQVVTDVTDKTEVRKTLTSGATSIAVSEKGKEIAFILNGDIFVTTEDYETTRNITNTSEQERNIDFSPDGRTLVYSSERNGIWGIYKVELTNKDDKNFIYSEQFTETPLIVSKEACFQPKFSPDGKKIAFLANRTELRIYDIETKKINVALEEKYNYSYTDGDQSFSWSPDSKWLLTKYIGIGGWHNVDIVLVKADGTELVNLTESGYSDSSPRWVLDGKAMIWKSDRAGFRSHGSWGAQSDLYIMFFDAIAYDKFKMNKEELSLLKGDDNKADSLDNAKKEIEPLTFDLENRKDRIVRLTSNSSDLFAGLLNKEGTKLFYLSKFEKGFDLWQIDFMDKSTKLISKGVGAGELIPSENLESFYILSNGIKRVDFKDGKTKDIKYKAEFTYRPYAEREYIFEHAWQQVKDKFYVKDLHNVDWGMYRETYEKFLPHINNNFDFQEMLSELLGELNGSHTGARYAPEPPAYPTAALGAFYDESYDKDGLKIKEVIAQGPLTVANSKIEAGCIIEKIDGELIEKGKDYFPLLKGKAAKKTTLTVYNPTTKERFEQSVKPITYDDQVLLLYKRWVKQRKDMTDKLSNGKVGYVHVKGMNSESFREVYSEILGEHRNKQAVLVDIRHNGGGWLHNDLAILLSGKEYNRYVPRGQYIGSDPFTSWFKPSAVLVCENCYSNAHGFPFMYKYLNIGKLVGTPVAGTMTAVWWEKQIDPTLIFGIPQTAVRDMDGNYLENQELMPDIEVYISPENLLKDVDTQLQAGVKHLLEESK
ncbi:MAG: S41 family peptidase [Rikenellaceae bacterium]